MADSGSEMELLFFDTFSHENAEVQVKIKCSDIDLNYFQKMKVNWPQDQIRSAMIPVLFPEEEEEEIKSHFSFRCCIFIE